MNYLKKKSKQPRNWLAVSAFMRNSAGVMKSKKKWEEDEEKTVDDWLNDAKINDAHEAEIELLWDEAEIRKVDCTGSNNDKNQYNNNIKGLK